ncbi:pyridoxamine 5'-phosphate oxidase family protein [Novispirillum sp. DQ9]|uniref:pyridoxamine 5'-phosphate oxidase family protein n=1 Tax=Novispirillum sp. DQ9 TaxID=3398612 RepID=UPI003C7A6153
MAQFFDDISPERVSFITAQKMFFVATAPAPDRGRVNLSPKGMDTFRVLGPRRVAYLDVTGSANETAAHLRDNGRITIMFCAFEGKALILRLYGTGRVITRADADWAEMLALFPPRESPRQVIDIAVGAVQTSCGEGVPLFDYAGDRTALEDWARSKGPDGIVEYWRTKNLASIDGLPTGLPVPEKD